MDRLPRDGPFFMPERTHKDTIWLKVGHLPDGTYFFIYYKQDSGEHKSIRFIKKTS